MCWCSSDGCNANKDVDISVMANNGRTHGALYCGHGYVPLRCGENVVLRTGTQQQSWLSGWSVTTLWDAVAKEALIVSVVLELVTEAYIWHCVLNTIFWVVCLWLLCFDFWAEIAYGKDELKWHKIQHYSHSRFYLSTHIFSPSWNLQSRCRSFYRAF